MRPELGKNKTVMFTHVIVFMIFTGMLLIMFVIWCLSMKKEKVSDFARNFYLISIVFTVDDFIT